MKFGNLDTSSVSIDGTQKVIYDSGELLTSASSITISGLNGDVDGEYELIVRSNIVAGGGGQIKVQFNGDTASNYGYQNLAGMNTTASAERSTATGMWLNIQANSASANTHFGSMKINAKSGYVRTSIVKSVGSVITTTCTDVEETGESWNNTADNITSMVVACSVANALDVGSRVILLKKVTATDGMKTGNLEIQGKVYGTWQEVYSTTLLASASSVTISGLKGDSDCLYKLRTRSIAASSIGAGAIYTGVRPNNDTTNSAYGYQRLTGINTTAGAYREGPGDSLDLLKFDNGTTANNLLWSDFLFYAKSGYIRTGLVDSTFQVNATSVGTAWLGGLVWTDTATEITSLVLLSSISAGLAIDTEIVLERLNL